MSERDPRTSQRIPLLGAPALPLPPPPASRLTLEEREIASMDLGAAFELASAELGFAAASWLFVEQVAALSGGGGVEKLRDELGASFSVLDFVAARWIDGERASPVDTKTVLRALAGVRRVVVVGLEANHLDALARDLDPSVKIGLLTYRLQRVDWDRVIANYGGRIEAVDLAEFQGWAGARSAILTFIYGTRGDLMNVLSAFLRVVGPDVRTQFRDIVGWNVLGGAPERYPRYLVETLTSELTALVELEPG
jgi:hypothetical protein